MASTVTSAAVTTASKQTVLKKKGGLLAGVKRANLKYTIDARIPVADEIFDLVGFERFLHNRFKIAGKTGVLGDMVTIVRDHESITVSSKVHFSKAYLKYLTKKFLKQSFLRDHIRIIASDKSTYKLRYFSLQNAGGDAEDAE